MYTSNHIASILSTQCTFSPTRTILLILFSSLLLTIFFHKASPVGPFYVAALACVLLTAIAFRIPETFRLRPLFIFVFLALTLLVLSDITSLLALNDNDRLYGLRRSLGFLLVFTATYFFAVATGIRKSLRFLIFIGTASLAIATINYFVTPILPYEEYAGSRGFRFTGFWGNPNRAAEAITLVYCSGLFLAAVSSSARKSVDFLGALAVLISCIILIYFTRSRAPVAAIYASFLLSLFLLCLYAFRQRFRAKSLFLLAPLLLAPFLVIAALYFLLLHKTEDTSFLPPFLLPELSWDPRDNIRFAIWNEHISAFLADAKSFILGGHQKNLPSPHNSYIYFFSLYGVFAIPILACFGSLIARSLTHAVPFLRIALSTGLLSWLIFGFGNDALTQSYFAVALAFLVAMLTRPNKQS